MSEESRIAALEARLEKLEHELGIQQDIEGVRRLHYIYMHYNTNRMTKQLLDLVSENAESIEIAGRGVYHGKKGFVTNFLHEEAEAQTERRDIGHAYANVLFQLGAMGVITISDDRQRAKGRFSTLTPSIRGMDESQRVNWNAGVYENEYIKEDGVWKIFKFKYVHYFVVTYKDLKVVPGYSRWPDTDQPPDAPTTWYHPFPEAGVLQYHYPNPVTGEMPREVLDPTHYWKGNWPGEFGQTGHV